jgi:hypothetical protein
VKSTEEQLEEATRHVNEKQRRIEEQLVLIERLKDGGHDTTEAERLLATYLQVMDTFGHHRDQLVTEADSKESKHRRS